MIWFQSLFFKTATRIVGVLRLSFFFLVSIGLSNPAHAHQFSTAYLTLNTNHQSGLTSAEYRLAIRDLALLIPLDMDGNRKITWGEIKHRQGDIEQLLSHDVQWQDAAQQPCKMNGLQQPFAVDQVAGMAYLVMYLSIDCKQQSLASLDYQMLAHIDSGHRLIISLLNLQNSRENRTWMISTGKTSLTQQSNERFENLKTYIEEGIHHILTGYDHLLFLLCLLLPAVYTRQNRQWVPVTSAIQAVKSTLYIATAFTLAHSITLSLAALSIISIPSKITESAIAFSIALAALNNIFSFFEGRQIRIAFLFGLIHGFGFASALSDLPIKTLDRVLALFSFNLGIELGQIACIVIFLPLALAIKDRFFYRHFIFKGGSILACVLALLWMIQRMFDLHLIPG